MSSIDRRSDPSASRSRRISCVAVLVEEVGDDDARLVQHDMAEPDAVVEGHAGRSSTGRDRSSSRPGRVSRARSPAAIISAITIAVVSSASTSSSR